MEKEENILGYEKIGKLIRKFSIPCIISLLVNSLYNIVDQIFIGWGVGYLGNGATNVVFPLTMICLAFALMFGDGASAYLSLKLGQKKNEEAAKGIGNGISLSVIISIILFTIIELFLPTLLNVFGCTDEFMSYALSYGRIIGVGLPFMIIGTTLNSMIRADGKPKYAMTSMVIGAILNVILDPTQMSIVLVIAFENNLLKKYGGESKFGSEIPITVLGIVMKISQILNSIIIGISAGAQPILGYNYGARKFERVKETLKIVLGLSVIISTIAFILFQTIPDKLISIFGSGDENYMEFACIAFRTYLMLCICNGIQIPSGIFFQAIGKSIKSAILSLSRQVLFLIPAMVVFGHMFGIQGVLYSGPFADGLAFIIASILLINEVRKLKNGTEKNIRNKKVDTNINNNENKHIIITLSREYGSGGRYIGKLVAEKLGIKLYDKEFITEIAEETGLSEEYIKENEQKRENLSILNNGYYFGLNNADELFIKESKLIKKVADEESCVIVGRCADYILRNREDVLKIFVYSDMENKIERATKFYGLNKESAKKEINRIDRLRANHYKYYTENDWRDSSNYDICINSDALGVEKASEIICDIVNNKVTVS